MNHPPKDEYRSRG